ncbi:hypothetical protein [Geomicrobium sp. JCM 19037]|nr:hypothetical protein [Geomicrobium sp. JCM 19037]
MTYTTCKRLIANGNYEKEDLKMKLDIFLLNDRVSEAEYNELINLINAE